MKPYYKLVFETTTGEKATINVPNAKPIPAESLSAQVKLSMGDIITGNAIKTKDGSSLYAAREAFYCTTTEQTFDVKE